METKCIEWGAWKRDPQDPCLEVRYCLEYQKIEEQEPTLISKILGSETIHNLKKFSAIPELTYTSHWQALTAWRNCEISTAELKTAVLQLHNDAPAWNDNDWEDYMLRDGFLIPNNRNQEATVGEWSEWSDCSPNEDGVGKQNRTREIVKHKLVNCVEDRLGHGFSLIEFRDCELPGSSSSSSSSSDDDNDDNDDKDGDDSETKGYFIPANQLPALALIGVAVLLIVK